MARALRAWAINRGGKNSVRNLRYGPRTRLVRGIYCSPLNFLPRSYLKIILNYFKLFLDESHLKLSVKFEKRNRQKSTSYDFNYLCFFFKPLAFRKFSRTITIHQGIFSGRALWADSVSPRTSSIASRDQFKPIRIEENLVVNYK